MAGDKGCSLTDHQHGVYEAQVVPTSQKPVNLMYKSVNINNDTLIGSILLL